MSLQLFWPKDAPKWTLIQIDDCIAMHNSIPHTNPSTAVTRLAGGRGALPDDRLSLTTSAEIRLAGWLQTTAPT
jgi:hypothetical protein